MKNKILTNKKAQELSASFAVEWFIQNIVLVIILFIILSFGVYFLIKFLTGF